MAGGAYGALVNAMGFYSLSKLFDRRLADMSSFESFETIFLDNIGYNLANLEIINAGTTLVVGLFL